MVAYMRKAIPVFIGLGTLAGLTEGSERWIRISVPQSVFSQTR